MKVSILFFVFITATVEAQYPHGLSYAPISNFPIDESLFNDESSDTTARAERALYDKTESIEDLVYQLNQFNLDPDVPIWNSYIFNTGSYNREELKIVEISADKNFYLDRQIKEWTTLKHHAVGRSEKGLTLATSLEDGTMKIDHQYDEIVVSSMCMFEWWVPDEKVLAIGLISAQNNIINWARLKDDNMLDKMWEWQLNTPIIFVTIFKLNNDWKVAVTREQSNGNDRSIEIYGVDLWKDWWFQEKLNGYGKPTIINEGIYIATVTKDYNSVIVYSYDYDKRRYFEYKTFSSPKVESISTFVVGTSSFLAIGGESPAIYEICGSEFVQVEVHNYYLNHVELYLAVPLGYYRNDALLLFQHKLDYSSHSSSILEALQWDGSKFTLLEHSPCTGYNDGMYGFSCMLDAEGENGIKGAMSFRTLDGENHVMVASEEHAPIMFNIKTQLVDLPNPLQEEYRQIVKAKAHLQELFLQQEYLMKEADSIAHSDMDFFATDEMKIKEINAPSVHLAGNIADYLYEDGYIDVAGQNWREIDLNMDVTQMFDRFKMNHERIKAVVGRMKGALMANDPMPHSMDVVKITGEIIARGDVKIEHAHMDILNGLKVDDVLEHAVKKTDDDALVIKGELAVENFKTDNIKAERINGINLKEDDDEVYTVYGDLEMQNHLHVLGDVDVHHDGTIDGIDFRKDIITSSSRMNATDDYLNFDQITIEDEFSVENTMNGFKFTKAGFDEVFEKKWRSDGEKLSKMDELNLDTLSVGKTFTFDDVNGRSWKEYTESLVLTDRDGSLDDLEVGGEVTVDGDLIVEILNTLAYPDDYVLIAESSPVVFTASKTFANGLQADEVDCEETIGGVVPEDIVTLTTRQNLNNFTFFNLTVTERMNVQGEITGKELNKFLSNPHLTEVNEINSNVIFKSLRINGTLKVSDRINETRWEDIFDGVIMKDDSPVRIDSFKTFDGSIFVEGGVNIRSGFLNSRKVSELLTTNTDQVISRGLLQGNINFGSLNVGGLFDGVNVTDLMENSVKLSGDQTIMSEVIFDNEFDLNPNSEEQSRLLPLEINSLKVKKLCNEWDPKEAVFLDQESLVLDSPQFTTLYADNLIVEGNVLAENQPICGLDLKSFDKIRLSKTIKKEIMAPYTIIDAYVDSLTFSELNGITEQDMIEFNEMMSNVDNEILYRNGNIGTLSISGRLNVTKLNGINLHEVSDKALWIKENNNLNGHIKFMDKLYSKSLYINNLAYGKKYDDYISDLVNIDSNPIVLKGRKKYSSGFDVQGNITTNYINGHKIEDIMLNNVDQYIEGNLYVMGNLMVKNNLDVSGLLQDIDVKKISESVEYLNENVIKINSDVTFYNNIHVNNLKVSGLINGVYDLKSITNFTAKMSGDNYFSNTVTFTKPVWIKSDFKTTLYNGIDLDYFAQDAVMIDDDASIDSVVIFEQPLIVEGKLYAGNLSADIIQGCSMEEWKNNAVYLNQWQEISGVKEFENLTVKGNLKVDKVNNIAFDNFMTLYGDQKIPYDLNVDRIFVESYLNVDGFVNQLKLDEAFQNTLMLHSDQVIESPIRFHGNILVNGETYIKWVNFKDFTKAVHLNNMDNLYGQYDFQGNVHFEKKLNINGLISNTDLNELLRNAAFSNDYGKDVIKGNWNIKGNLVFENNITGSVMLQGMKLENINRYLAYRDATVENQENHLKLTNKRHCHVINRLNEALEKIIDPFNRIEETQRMLIKNMASIHNFAYNNQQYILTVVNYDCLGTVWKLNQNSQYENISRTEMGCPIKWHSIKTRASFYLVSQNRVNCKCTASGITIWSFDGTYLQLVQNMIPAESVHVPEGNEGYIYFFDAMTIRKFQIQDTDGQFNLMKISFTTNMDSMRILHTPGNLMLSNEKSLFQLSPDAMILNRLNVKNKIIAKATEIVDFHVGKYGKKLYAVALPNDANFGVIIYDNLFNGEIIQSIPCLNPSSLISIELDSGQTLLIFLENYESIKFYIYHGFQGFKYLYEYRIHTFKVDLVVDANMKMILISTNSGLIVGEVKMYGQKLKIDKKLCDD